jgi:hypothetical protein
MNFLIKSGDTLSCNKNAKNELAFVRLSIPIIPCPMPRLRCRFLNKQYTRKTEFWGFADFQLVLWKDSLHMLHVNSVLVFKGWRYATYVPRTTRISRSRRRWLACSLAVHGRERSMGHEIAGSRARHRSGRPRVRHRFPCPVPYSFVVLPSTVLAYLPT